LSYLPLLIPFVSFHSVLIFFLLFLNFLLQLLFLLVCMYAFNSLLTKLLFYSYLPANVPVYRLSLLLEIPAPNLGQGSATLSEGFRCLPQSLQLSSRYWLGNDRFLPHPLQFVVDYPSCHSTLCTLTSWRHL
jgi:hypothetical protein